MEELTIAQLNWELAMADLDDSIKYLQECRVELDKAMKNLAEFRKRLG